MTRSIDAIVETDGRVRLMEKIHLDAPRRAVVTILEDTVAEAVGEAALLSEPALALDWDRPEEDEAWTHLLRDR